jgi:hypothetical protein
MSPSAPISRSARRAGKSIEGKEARSRAKRLIDANDKLFRRLSNVVESRPMGKRTKA